MKLNIWIVLLAFIIINLILGVRTDIIDRGELKEKTRILADKIKLGMEEEKTLILKLKLLDDENYIERIARSDLNLVKKGETAYKICY